MSSSDQIKIGTMRTDIRGRSSHTMTAAPIIRERPDDPLREPDRAARVAGFILGDSLRLGMFGRGITCQTSIRGW